jgi:hypothetical protein
MIDLTGEAVLALWNGFAPERVREYDLWHSREHVPERIGVPGMLAARRYERVDGPLPRFLTLYDLERLDVLTSAAYRHLLDNPTEWSRSMRPGFCDFMRLCCRRIAWAGGGIGGCLMAVTVDETVNFDWAAEGGWLERLLAEPAIVAVHVLRTDPAIPAVPFAAGGASPDFPRGGAVLVESFSQERLLDSRPRIAAVLADLIAAEAVAAATIYRLVYALDRDSLARLVPLRMRS